MNTSLLVCCAGADDCFFCQTDVTTIDLDCSVEDLSSKVRNAFPCPGSKLCTGLLDALHTTCMHASHQQVDELEFLVNQKIREGIHLHAKEYPIAEVWCTFFEPCNRLRSVVFASFGDLPDMLSLVATGRFACPKARTLSDLRVGKKGLPEGLESMRIVRIDGLESNACCGTHVQSLGKEILVLIPASLTNIHLHHPMNSIAPTPHPVG